jgi:signal peptidase I
MSFIERLLDFLTARRVTIAGESMLPSLRPGDRVVFSSRVYRKTRPARGDVVLLRSVDDPERTEVKRVVGMPGETLQVRDGRVWVGGSPPAEPYLPPANQTQEGDTPEAEGDQTASAWPAWTLDEDEYFVMGDNRRHDHVIDSRRYGPVPRSRIVGRMERRF